MQARGGGGGVKEEGYGLADEEITGEEQVRLFSLGSRPRDAIVDD